MAMLVMLCTLAFAAEAYAVHIIPQPATNFIVQQGQRVILPFNYTLDPTERDKVVTIGLGLNGSAVLSYVEFRGTAIENNFLGHLIGRSDVQLQASPRSYVGLLIERTTTRDSGRYKWDITSLGTKQSDVPMELIVGNKPGSASLVSSHVVGLVYTLTCTITGGIPSPNITILNGTEVIHTTSASTTTINVTVEFPSVFFCVGANVLGSTNESLALPEPTTNGVTITGPSLERLVVEYGDEIALFCNYTLQSGETDTVGTTATLNLNGSTVANRVYYYSEAGGSGQNSLPNPYFNYFLTRSGVVEELRYPNSIGIRIQNTQWTDSGNYTWYLTIDGNNAGIVSKTYEVIIGEKPRSASLVSSHVGGMVYTLTCRVTGGIPSPNITILNGTEVIQTSVASTTTINVTVEFSSVFYCVGTNVLGSTDKSSTILSVPFRDFR